MSETDVTSGVLSRVSKRQQVAEVPEIEIRSEVVQDIISHTPGWTVRAGNTVAFVCILLLLVMSWYIRYPDVVRARITITTEQFPVRVVAPDNGKLERIFVGEKDRVDRGTLLAVIDNAADYEDMLVLLDWVRSADTLMRTPGGVSGLAPLPAGLSLGIVHDHYVSLQQRFAELEAFKRDEYYTGKRDTYERQVAEYERLDATLRRQKEILSQERALAAARVERDQLLLERQVISQLQVDESKALLLQKQFAGENAERSLADNQIRLAEVRSALAEFDRQLKERHRSLHQSLLEGFEQLKNQTVVWQQQYLLSSPIEGRVSFVSGLQENQFVQTSEVIMAIVPETGEIFGNVLLPQSGAGKVSVGKKLRIMLDSYPAAEYGVVEGIVEDISLVSRDQAYLIKTTLPQGLKTNYGIKLEFRQEMEGDAEFITEDIRLLERILDWLRIILDK